MRALITGSRGFVGQHLARHLLEQGDVVEGIDRERDVTDRASMLDAFSHFRPDVTFHLAALTHVGQSWRQPDEFTRVNVVGTQCVLDAAFEVVPSSTIVLVSSAEVYGVVSEDDLPLAETHRLAPSNPYAASKVEAERVANEAVRTRGQRVVIARPFNHLGPGQSTNFVVPALVSRLLDAREHGRDEVPVGDLSTRRDFSDVRDIVRAYRLLAALGQSGEAYNVASGYDVALTDVAKQLASRIAPHVKFVVDPTLLRPVDVPASCGNYHKLRAATGWTPAIPLSVSLDDIVSDMIARRRRV